MALATPDGHDPRKIWPNDLPATPSREDLSSTTYEFFILAVSILSIANLALAVALPLRSPRVRLIVAGLQVLTGILARERNGRGPWLGAFGASLSAVIPFSVMSA